MFGYGAGAWVSGCSCWAIHWTMHHSRSRYEAVKSPVHTLYFADAEVVGSDNPQYNHCVDTHSKALAMSL
jgi:hypothetical protein